MRFVLVGLAVLCLIIAVCHQQSGHSGFCLLAAVLLSLGAVFVFWASTHRFNAAWRYLSANAGRA
ncbi:MAG: hypothetical protein IPH50_03640 [Rhodanobacteraceae bacterium]|nr:hypothetical protein [Rhodanobacteraceae bacterium]